MPTINQPTLFEPWRVCGTCGEYKPPSAFGRKKRKQGLRQRSDCKACWHDKQRALKYGVSPEWYRQTLTAQQGVCAICEGECTRFPSLSVDHNHQTGQVRGLLCHNCNTMLGYSRESIRTLQRAIDYLNHYHD